MDSKIKILYIDDEELNLTAFVRLFRRLYDITTASSAKLGREILKTQSFHIILVDQRMPDTTGAAFFKEIANIYPDSMRVLVTAYSDLDAVISAVNDGKIYKYISKPYKKEEMMTLVEGAFHVHHLREIQKNDFTKYKEAFVNSKDSIFLLSKNGKIIDANDSFINLLELSRNDLVVQEIETDFFSKISIPFEISASSNEYEEFVDKEATFQMKNGEVYDCLVSFLKISLEDEAFVGYQGTIKNITKYKVSKRNSMRGLLEQKEKENETVVNVLHENSAQNLASIHYMLSNLEKNVISQDARDTLTRVNSTLVETIKELRGLCFQISPKSLEFGISSALEDLADKMKLAYNATSTIEIQDELGQFSKDFRVMVFRTIQNVLKALEKVNSNVSITISSDKYFIYLELRGKKLEGNEGIIDQVSTEIDCYTGTIIEKRENNNQTCYKMVFPIYQV